MTQEEHTMHVALNRTAPPPAERLGAPYLEINGTYAVHNRYLRITLLCAGLVILLMSAAGWRFAKEYADRKPLVIRVNAEGDAQAAPYSILEYKPREPEIRYFLNRFVIDHFSLVRATAKDAFQRKLYFLSAEMAKKVMDTESPALATFMATGTEEVDVEVSNVTIEQLETSPYKASISFDKVVRTVASTQPVRRERFVSHVQFKLLEKTPNSLIPVNPLGMVITYLRSDQAFDQPSPTHQQPSARLGGAF
jgi:type IV secretory pathway TrbF-like protein